MNTGSVISKADTPNHIIKQARLVKAPAKQHVSAIKTPTITKCK